MTANDKTGVGSGRGNWRTPPELFARLDRMFAFNYDAFASHENALCDRYSTVDGTFLLNAAFLETGLLFRGRYRRFGNPPYSRGFLEPATQWFAETRNDFDVSVMLLPDARDTAWWREWVRPYATDYPIGRVHFIHPDGDCGSKVCAAKHVPGEPCRDTPGGSVVVVYLPDWLRGESGP